MARPPEWNEWVEEVGRLLAAPSLPRGQRATRGPEDPRWATGDFLLKIPPRYLAALADEVDYSLAELKRLRDTSRQFPKDKRVAAAWSTHRDCRTKKHLLRPGMPHSRTNDKRTVAEKVTMVRELLADHEVYEIIENDLKTSRADRKTRRALKVHKELLREAQDVEAELRENAQADRPVVASMKTQAELLRIAAYIDAVRRGIGDMADPQRVIKAAHRVDAQMCAFFDEVEPPPSGEPNHVVVDGEAWQADLSRALPM
jgi:hypothetical protein